MNFNFNELTKLNRKITREGGSADLSRNTDKDGKTTFRIAQDLFDKMGLQLNSLSTMTHPKDKKQVFIVVCPGNTGDLLKAREGKKSKGNTFLHNELSKALDDAGFKGQKEFNLVSVGSHEGREYFQVQEIQQGSPEIAEAKPALTGHTVKKAEKAHA